MANNDFDFLHIKNRTAGSSNELSFDVLDAAREGLDGKKKRGRHGANRAAKGMHNAKGSYKGVAGNLSLSSSNGNSNSRQSQRTASLSGTPEVARRKRERRASSLKAWLAVFLIGAVIVGAGAYFGYRYYQQRTDFTTQFTMLVDELVEVDQKLVNVDIMMKDPAGAVKSNELDRTMKEIPKLADQLTSVIREAEARIDTAHSDAEIEAFSEVVATAEARQDLLDSAKDALTLFGDVGKQMAKADEAASNLLEADQLARDAAALANSATTEEATTAARDRTYEAYEKMSAALSQVEELEKANKGLKLTEWKKYLETRIKALDYAVETSTALLSGNRDEAAAANSSYNSTEKEAAELAAELPTSLSSQVRDFYKEKLGECEADYQSVRTHVTTTDANLRNKVPA